ncbi:MAG: CocE/NonD family hydrolase [Planctomycetota bacterium]|nr:CocE/NonD family hydrolase [Planctomycetota bacterium]
MLMQHLRRIALLAIVFFFATAALVQAAQPKAPAPPSAKAKGDQLEQLLAAFGASKQTVMVPMADGVKLATDVYLPPGDGPFPVILTRTPYSRTKAAMGGVAVLTQGYACVLQDMRGRFDSEGENLPFIGCGWEGTHDGADTVAWIAQQSWCNKKIGTFGPSACGITQNLMAGAVPPGLTAQFIGVAADNLYAEAAYVGGAYRKEQLDNWTTNTKFDPKALDLYHTHVTYDEFWQRFNSASKHAVMNVPAVHVGGWFDTFCQGTINAFVGRQYQGAAGGKGMQKLIMGPWDHGGAGIGGVGSLGRLAGRAKVGELTFRNSTFPGKYDLTRWFDCLLKGTDNGVLKEPAVAYYVMGDTETPDAPGNEWRYSDVWPIACAETPYYFTKDGGLAQARPSAAGPQCREYTFDPADPCPTLGGCNLTIPAGPKNQNSVESRKDVLLFTTEPLAEPVEVTGRVGAKVWVSSSAVDTDVSVRFCDVYPDGRSFMMAEGILRLRCRDSVEKPAPLVPGKLYEVAVDCWSTSIVINKGHRIRCTVTSSNHPRFDVNPGTGKSINDGPQLVKQTNRIFCDAEHPSRIILPVVKAAAVAKS